MAHRWTESFLKVNYLCSGSAALLRGLNPIHKKGPKVFFFSLKKKGISEEHSIKVNGPKTKNSDREKFY